VSRPAPHHQAAAAAAARHEAGAHHVNTPFERPQRPGLGRIVGGLALAAAVAVAAFGIYTLRSNSVSTPAGASAAAQDSSLAAQVASLRASVAQKDSVIAGLTGMHTRVIDLVSVSSADPMGKVFWNQEQQTFVMYASNLKPPAAGKTYQVWLIARGGAPPMSAGTFVPDATGSAVMTTWNPVQPGSLRRVAVTEEAAGGAAAPTGPVLFSGVGR
jgi:anti-sigma-K factor RskA